MWIDFQERMAGGKDRAKAHRDAGGSTVRVYATTQAMHADRDRDSEPELFAAFLQRAYERRQEAIDSYRYALWGHEWREGFEMEGWQ